LSHTRCCTVQQKSKPERKRSSSAPAAGSDSAAAAWTSDRSSNARHRVERKTRHPAEYGATPVDYRTQDFVEVIRQAEPDGLDVVLDA